MTTGRGMRLRSLLGGVMDKLRRLKRRLTPKLLDELPDAADNVLRLPRLDSPSST